MSRWGRWLVGASIAVAWMGALDGVPGPVKLGDAAVFGVPAARLVSAPVLVVATLVLLALLARFVVRSRPETPVLAGLFALFFVVARLEALDPLGEAAIGHGKFLPGVILLALTVGSVRGRGDPDSGWARGVDLAAGTAAALYVWAGAIKLWEGGLGWAVAANLPMLVHERVLAEPDSFVALRTWVVERPALGPLLAWVVLGIELGGVAFVVPALRVPFAVAATAMHLGIGLLVGYAYPEWILAMWGLALWSRDAATS